MQRNEMQGVLRREVTAAEREDITLLIELCNQQDGLDFPIPVNMIGISVDSTTRPLLYYAGQVLAGFVYLQDGAEIELYGMVHSAYRRRGIGTRLLQEAREICLQQRLPAPLLVNDGVSSSV